MPIHTPTDGFPGERNEESQHGGTCPLCGEDFDGMLPDHLEYHCEET